MKWSHTDLGHTLHSAATYAQGHRIQIGAIGAVVATGMLAYGISVATGTEGGAAAVSSTHPAERVSDRSRIQPTEIVIETTTQEAAASEDAAPVINGRVRVNDTTISIPKNGGVNKHISSENGATSIDMSVNSSSSTKNNSSQHTELNINVESSSASESAGVDTEVYLEFDDYE